MNDKSRFRKEYSLDETLSVYLGKKIINKRDAEILRKYLADRSVTLGPVNKTTQHRIIVDICIAQRIKPIVEISALTIDIIYAKIQNLHASDYKQNTKSLIIAVNKSFWKYLSENKIIDLDYNKIKSIKNVPINYDTTTAEEILTPNEIMSLVEHAGPARDRAFVATLYESAARISEIARLRWKDLFFDKDGVGIWLQDKKTNKNRYTRMFMAKPHLLEWKNSYSRFGNPEGDNLVFITYRGNQITYIQYYKLLQKIANNAGITKRVHLHLLRKSRITHLSKDNYSEFVIKEVAWGNQNTNMMRTYSKLSHKDIDNEFMRKSGLMKSEASETDILHPTRCARCNAVLSPDQKFCSNCGLSRDTNALNAALSIDPELLSRVLDILKNQQK